MDFALRDKSVLLLKEQIKCRQRMLLERFQSVREASNENKVLQGVVKDYQEYYNELIKSKKEQAEALSLLRDYLEGIQDIIDVSDEQMDYLKQEKQETIERLQNVRNEMESLVKVSNVSMS